MAGSNSKDKESERSADSVMTHNNTVQASSNSNDMKSKTHNDDVQASSNSNDMESKRLTDSLMTMMVCIQDDTVQACSISAVPKRHGKSQVEDVYTPRAVSIGPLHRGASTDLLHMEDIKWRCMFNLLHRTPSATESLLKCTHAMLKLDEIVRASYNVYEIKFNSYDLAKIMLLDGCFLLELLISGSQQLNTKLECRLKVPKRAEISKREVVFSDLTVVENQIPLIILTELAELLFPSDVRKMETMDSEVKSSDNPDHILEFFHSFKDRENQISLIILPELARQLFTPDVCKMEILLPLFGDSSDSGVKSSNNPAHILELVHSFIGREIKNLNDNRAGEQVLVNINTKNHPNPKPKLERCATTLEAAGIKFKPQEKSERGPSDMEIRFDLKIKFDSRNATLEIPQLHITETTEAKWKNFIAWELTKNEDAKSTDAIGSIFIWYALFFQGLLCSVHDIQLLRDKGIILVHDAQSGKKKKKLSNEELLIFFGNLTEGVHDDDQIVKNSHFSMLFQYLNSHPTPLDWIKRVSRSIWDFFSHGLTGIRHICEVIWGYCSPVLTKIEDIFKKWYICIIMWHACRCVVTRILHSFRNSFKILIREHITTRWKLIVIVAAVLTFALTFIQTFFPDPFH